jgi:hypothetical protein
MRTEEQPPSTRRPSYSAQDSSQQQLRKGDEEQQQPQQRTQAKQSKSKYKMQSAHPPPPQEPPPSWLPPALHWLRWVSVQFTLSPFGLSGMAFSWNLAGKIFQLVRTIPCDASSPACAFSSMPSHC